MEARGTHQPSRRGGAQRGPFVGRPREQADRLSSFGGKLKPARRRHVETTTIGDDQRDARTTQGEIDRPQPRVRFMGAEPARVRSTCTDPLRDVDEQGGSQERAIEFLLER